MSYYTYKKCRDSLVDAGYLDFEYRPLRLEHGPTNEPVDNDVNGNLFEIAADCIYQQQERIVALEREASKIKADAIKEFANRYQFCNNEDWHKHAMEYQGKLRVGL